MIGFAALFCLLSFWLVLLKDGLFMDNEYVGKTRALNRTAFYSQFHFFFFL